MVLYRTGYNRKVYHGGFRQSGGGVEENRLKMCLEGVNSTEGWIHALRGGGGFF